MTSPLVDTFEQKRVASVAFGDLIALAKPRITALVVITTAGGYWLAPVNAGSLAASKAFDLGSSVSGKILTAEELRKALSLK